MPVNRKLIEVSLPLEEINTQSARENYIYKGNPSSVHKWWAQRPLATARAILFAQLVDDPSNDLALYRQEAVANGFEDPDAWAEHKVKQERERLFALIRKMVDWDNLGDEALFDEVRAEIMRSTKNEPPAILDPFAGGGTIPLEAQRLGIEALASDLNPVAVLINKALIEFPPKFTGREPVFPHAAEQRNSWPRATGLSEDIRRYGAWMRDEAERRIGHLYPKVGLPSGGEAIPIAWIWARTVTCPNPACGIEMPLVRSWWLGKKKGKEAYVVPSCVAGRVVYEVGHDLAGAPDGTGTVGRTGATCISCGTAVPLEYVRAQSREVGLGRHLLATVAESQRGRVYVAPDDDQRRSADVALPASLPAGDLPEKALSFRVQAYGMTEWVDLFTNRQLTALTTFSDLVADVRLRVLADARATGASEGTSLESGGTGAAAYADAIATYLAFAVDKYADYGCALAVWYPAEDRIKNLFARQSIPMVWDFPEIMPFTSIGGGFSTCIRIVSESIEGLGVGPAPLVIQADAATRTYSGAVVSTDPPYYDNIGYSDLSDFFYIWLRRSLRDVMPSLLSTMLVPKAEELVANPFRHSGPGGAKDFFETGFEQVFARARESASSEYPITVYYAFKQSETKAGENASTGWETILASMVRAGWAVTATWPVRSERVGRTIGLGSNALASSVVVGLRPRPEDAAVTDRRGFIAAMKRELGPALRELQQGGIAPVDLPQSAIGPGMAVFSRYAKVIESDGSEMTVRSALARINEVLDEVLTEQEGDFDPTTRFAIAWYRSHGYEAGTYGDADSLARARATAVSAMERGGILNARAGRVQLHRPSTLPDDYDVSSDQHTSTWEALQHAVRVQEKRGIPAAGSFLREASRRHDGAVDLDLVKELAYLLARIAAANRWTKDEIMFNNIVTSWSEMLDARPLDAPAETPVMLDFDALDG